mgnify:CR=1 FL=1
MSKPGVHEQLAAAKDKIDRLTVENSDLQRRIKEKDERALALQTRASKATEQLVTEQTEKRQMEASLKKAEAEIVRLNVSLSEMGGRAERAEAAAKEETEKLQTQLADVSAALAAADAASGAVPGVPCDRAAEVASALGAGMRSCELVELIATVSVSVPFGAFEVTATARAGPPP